jgi:hypothetical protein
MFPYKGSPKQAKLVVLHDIRYVADLPYPMLTLTPSMTLPEHVEHLVGGSCQERRQGFHRGKLEGATEASSASSMT